MAFSHFDVAHFSKRQLPNMPISEELACATNLPVQRNPIFLFAETADSQTSPSQWTVQKYNQKVPYLRCAD